jgi:hypothetical protein
MPAVWYPPVYTPATVTMPSSGTATLTVANTLACERGGYVPVQKTVTNNTQADISGLNYPVTVTCGGSAHPFSLVASVPQLIHNLPVGTVCTPAETLPAAPTSGCPAGQVPTWAPPVYAPASITTVLGTNPTLTVQNTLNCKTPPQLKPMSLQCHPPLVANPAGTACVCPQGMRKSGQDCVRQLECRAPARSNKAGTACLCPQGMTRKGNTCVPQERRKPKTPERKKPNTARDDKQGVTPGDVIRVLPGLLGGGRGGGRGTNGPSGGGGGGAVPKR